MRKTSKSALYSTIKSTVKKLGISTEDTTGIINYIKFIESNAPVETEVKVTSKGKKDNVSPAGEVILSVLSKDIDKPYGIQDIADATGFKYAKVQVELKGLKAAKKIKIVDFISGSAGPSKLLYQTWKSPLKALNLVTEKQGYSTLNGFIKNNKKLLAKSTGITSFASVVEESGITSYPLSLNIGVSKGYRNSDLKSLALGNISEEKPTKRKYTKKASKPKRKYTKRAKVQPVEPPIADVSTGLGFIGKLFKKKNHNTSDLIKF